MTLYRKEQLFQFRIIPLWSLGYNCYVYHTWPLIGLSCIFITVGVNWIKLSYNNEEATFDHRIMWRLVSAYAVSPFPFLPHIQIHAKVPKIR